MTIQCGIVAVVRGEKDDDHEVEPNIYLFKIITNRIIDTSVITPVEFWIILHWNLKRRNTYLMSISDNWVVIAVICKTATRQHVNNTCTVKTLPYYIGKQDVGVRYLLLLYQMEDWTTTGHVGLLVDEWAYWLNHDWRSQLRWYWHWNFALTNWTSQDNYIWRNNDTKHWTYFFCDAQIQQQRQIN